MESKKTQRKKKNAGLKYMKDINYKLQQQNSDLKAEVEKLKPFEKGFEKAMKLIDKSDFDCVECPASLDCRHIESCYETLKKHFLGGGG